MPFQSEKQRRYLWANEPEIARDWTNTYGSRVRKQGGGIMETILMQLAKTYGVNKAMEMLGMGKDSDQDNNLPEGYFGNLMSNFSPMKSLSRFGLNQAFKGMTGGSGMSGFGGALLPMAGAAGLVSLLNKNRLGLTGYTTQRGYEKARQDRRNIKSQHDIIKTLESGKYAPGWDKTAFERVQEKGKDLDLVDAGESSMNLQSRGNNQSGGGYSGAGAGVGRSGPPGRNYNIGGLAGLWQR